MSSVIYILAFIVGFIAGIKEDIRKEREAKLKRRRYYEEYGDD